MTTPASQNPEAGLEDLLALLDANPVLAEQLRRRILVPRILELPELTARLEQGLVSLQETVAGIAEQARSNTEAIAALTRHGQELDQRLDRLAAAQEATNARLDAFIAEQKAMNARLEESIAELKATNARFDQFILEQKAVNARQEQHNAVVDTFITDQKEHNAGVDAFIVDQKEHNAGVDAFIVDQKEHNAGVDAFIVDQKEHNAGVDAFIVDQKEFNAEQKTFNARQEAFNSRQEAHNTYFQEQINGLKTDVGHLKGSDSERRAEAAIGTLLRRADPEIRRTTVLLSQQTGLRPDFEELLADAGYDRTITSQEQENLESSDLIVRAEGRGPNPLTVHYAVEISRTVNENDIDRARRRAAILSKAVNGPAKALVIGGLISETSQSYADAHQVSAVAYRRLTE